MCLGIRTYESDAIDTTFGSHFKNHHHLIRHPAQGIFGIQRWPFVPVDYYDSIRLNGPMLWHNGTEQSAIWDDFDGFVRIGLMQIEDSVCAIRE